MKQPASMQLAWLTPQWPVSATVRALSTWRGGGVSEAPYASLNLADHVGDLAGSVALNRRRLCEQGALPEQPSWLAQVHGCGVADLDAAAPGTAGVSMPPQADAAFTRQPGRVCAILTADCLPILFASRSGDLVAAAHAGWRGLAAGVLEATVRALGVPAQSLLAWLGPGIGSEHFEIDAPVRQELLRADAGAEAAFEENARGRFMADLSLLARRRLARLGVAEIYGTGECTHADADRYFSHRRDGRTGRQATLIWMQPAPPR